MKARRRVVPGGPTRRTPTVRRIKPAILPAPPKPSVPGGGRATGPAVPGRPSAPAAPGAPERPASAPALDVLGAHPVDLEVDLGRGLVLRTPLLAGAGSLGYGVEAADLVDLDRLGGLVTRGTTLRARPGHRGTRVAEVPGGLLNGVGLQNPGIDAVIERYAPAWGRWRVPVIVNLGGESATDVAECARRLEGVPGVAGIELNLSCANAARGGVAWGMDEDAAGTLTGAVRRATDLPLIVKLTPAAADIRAVARAVEDAGADAISAVNTLPGLAVAADRDGPRLASGYGGISGPALRPVALRVVFEVAQVVDVPVIGLGGVTSLDDVLDLLAVGATAVGITTACFADPMLPVRLADELADACRARGLDSVRPLVGTALPRRASPPSTRGAEYAR